MMFYHVQDMVQSALSRRQFTDVLTKPLSKSKYFRDKLSIAANASLDVREC